MIPEISISDAIDDYGISLFRLALSACVMVLLALLSRRLRLRLERDITNSSIRGFVQILLMASIILIVFEMDILALNLFVLGGMIVLASRITATRSIGLPDNDIISFQSILAGSSTIIILMLLLGALPPEAHYLIPLGGMVIGNCMNVTSLALDRLKGEVRNDRLRIEAYLALGSSWQDAIRPAIRKSIRASLIPNIDSMNTLGLIWIPGLMSGMLIAGTDPYVAASLQLLIITMILGASMIASVLGTHLMARRLFTDALQLIRIP